MPSATAADEPPQLAPNGLPYTNKDEEPVNEWARRSDVLRNLPADPVRSTHPFVVARPRGAVGGGLGLFTLCGIRKGEVVWAELADAGGQTTATPRSRAWIEALPAAAKRAYCHYMYKTGPDTYQSLAEFNDLPVDQYPSARTVDIANYMNHSCEPTCAFVDGGAAYANVMVALRDLYPGEEITYDYATSEDCELAPAWECACGAEACRGRVAPDDWKRPELQERYAGMFLPHIAERIDADRLARDPAAAPMPPLRPVDVGSAWWVTLQADGVLSPSSQAGLLDKQAAHRRKLLGLAARGQDLEVLNRQAAALICANGLAVRSNDRVGRYIEAGVDIPAGSVVMLLPPNLLLWEDEVQDFNRCLQVGAVGEGEHRDRLFSSSLSEMDLDNFLCHSCEPNCTVEISHDWTAALVAKRDIAKGEGVSFDYDSTEDDLRDDRGGFDCHCGAPACRGVVLGRLFASEPSRLPPLAAVVV